MGSLKQTLKGHVQDGKLEKAVDELINVLSGADADLEGDAIMQKSRLSKLNADIRIGIISDTQASMTRARIIQAVLYLIGELKG